MPAYFQREELAWAAGLFDGEGTAVLAGVNSTRARIPRRDGGATTRRRPHEVLAIVPMLWPWLSGPKRRQIAGVIRGYLTDASTRRAYSIARERA